MKSRMPGKHGGWLALVAALVYAVGCATSQPDFDLVFTGGTLIDGTGAEPRRADVGIKGDRVAAIGNLESRSSSTTIDVAGKTIAPGFIDLLSRSGVTLLADGVDEINLRQGITTEILGGGSPAFWTNATADADALRVHGVTLDWSGLNGYFMKLAARGNAITVGTFAPMSIAAGPNSIATLEQWMHDGAFGILDDAHASLADIQAAAAVVGRNDGVLAIPIDSPAFATDDALIAVGTQARRVLITGGGGPAAPFTAADSVRRMVLASQRNIFVCAAVNPATAVDEMVMRDLFRQGGMMMATDSAAPGAFPRLLGQMTRDAHVMELREAIRRSTSLAASLLSLQNRGIVREKYFADLVVFDERTIADRATVDHPAQSPAGIDYVVSNGVVVVNPKGLTGARPGYRLIHGR